MKTTGYTYDVLILNNLLFVCDGYAGLHIFDISNPQTPIELGHLNTPGDAIKVAVRDSFAYVADDFCGLRIIDISNPVQPNEVAYYDTPGEAIWIAVDSVHAYIGDLSEGLQIINIQNPYAPYFVSQWKGPDLAYVWGVAVLDTLFFLSGLDVISGQFVNLTVLNIINPLNPDYVNGLNFPAPPHGLTVTDSFAYICCQDSGIRIVDISNPDINLQYYGRRNKKN